MTNNRSRVNRSRRRRQPRYVWRYFDVTTESTASPRTNSKFQTNRLKLKITVFFFSFLMLPNFWKSITFDEKNPTLSPLFPLWKRKNQIIKTLPIVNSLKFPNDYLLLLLLDGSPQALLVCPLVKTKMSMNTGRKTMTRETKYSEKNPAIRAEQCSTLKFIATINRTKGWSLGTF